MKRKARLNSNLNDDPINLTFINILFNFEIILRFAKYFGISLSGSFFKAVTIWLRLQKDKSPLSNRFMFFLEFQNILFV